MSKSAKSTEGIKAARVGQLWLRLPGMVREALYETVIGAGLACVDEVLEAERVLVRRALRAFDRSRGVARGPRRKFVGAGWKASRSKSAAGAECRRSRTQVTELASMECARSVAAARGRADGVGSIDPALRALAGTVAGSNHGAGHQQERGERALRLRHRA